MYWAIFKICLVLFLYTEFWFVRFRDKFEPQDIAGFDRIPLLTRLFGVRCLESEWIDDDDDDDDTIKNNNDNDTDFVQCLG